MALTDDEGEKTVEMDGLTSIRMEGRRILDYLDFEQHSDLSTHLYSAFLLRRQTDGRFPSVAWTDWPLSSLEPRNFEDDEYLYRIKSSRCVPAPIIDTIYTDVEQPRASILTQIPILSFATPSVHLTKMKKLRKKVVVKEVEISEGGEDGKFNEKDRQAGNNELEKQENEDSKRNNEHEKYEDEDSEENNEIKEDVVEDTGDHISDDNHFIDDNQQLPPYVNRLSRARQILLFEMNSAFQKIIQKRINESFHSVQQIINPEPRLGEQALSHLLAKLNNTLENLAHIKYGRQDHVTTRGHRKLTWTDVISANGHVADTFERCKRLFLMPLDEVGEPDLSKGVLPGSLSSAEYVKLKIMDNQNVDDPSVTDEDLIDSFRVEISNISQDFEHIDEIQRLITRSSNKRKRTVEENGKSRKRILDEDLLKYPH